MIDKLDIKILREFDKLTEDEETTTWKIMRKLFPEGRSAENNRLKKRIRKMANLGLFHVTDEIPQHFMMIQDNVIFKKTKFIDRTSDSIHVKICDKWKILEI